MIVKLNKKSKYITTLKPGYIYEDSKGVEYLFIGYGGYNLLTRNRKKWEVVESVGECPCEPSYKYYNKGPVFMYLKVKDLKNYLPVIPNNFKELFQLMINVGLYYEILRSKESRKFVKEKDLVLKDLEEVDENLIPNIKQKYAFAFNLIKDDVLI